MKTRIRLDMDVTGDELEYLLEWFESIIEVETTDDVLPNEQRMKNIKLIKTVIAQIAGER